MTFAGSDVTAIRGRDLKEYRKQVQMVFQDPFASLNPTHTVNTIMRRSFASTQVRRAASEMQKKIEQSLELVGLSPAHNFLGQFPHELSGGQRQRVALARSLVVNPKLVVADEPVSMLDVSLRLGVLNLMLELNRTFHVAYVYITHDLASAKYVASRIAVMYAGEIVEEGPAGTLIENCRHPYTKVLVAAAPDPEQHARNESRMVKGEPPNLGAPFEGCPFQFRCPDVQDVCRTQIPPMVQVDPGHRVKCHMI